MTSRDQKFFVAGAEFHRFLSPYQKLNSFYHQVEISTLGFGSIFQNSHYRLKWIVEIEHTYIPFLSLQLWKAEIFRVKINPQTTWKPSILRSKIRNLSPMNSAKQKDHGSQPKFTHVSWQIERAATVADNACCIRLGEHSDMLFVVELVLLDTARPWKQNKIRINGKNTH